ncbi:mechanosensitive ion channel family protein [Nitratiruptor sp. YY09-18]|uniref:mechanosensitive ion channel family protein n=1 Tax=Nitratiruptor sp. YY09-18 TaxID=2724901 RepID=UPI0019378FAD|nr:mechanosensitive ion channel family protein [Nitratiruptor sp. YY09-18]BCD67648.1 MscS family membrane protein [Nitratiruptor sp. YY09-18]
MQIFALFLLLTSMLLADINMTLVKESNLTLLQNFANELNSSSPNYSLQKSLIQKIVSIAKQQPPTITNDELQIKNAQDLIQTFKKINNFLAQSYEKQQEIEDLNEQLSDIQENQDEDSITATLEYAFYYRLKEFDQKFVEQIQKNYTKWLDTLLIKLNKISFTKSAESISKTLSQLQNVERKIKKLQIEKERYVILGQESKIRQIEKSIAYYQNRAERYVDKILSIKLYDFFAALQKRSQESINKAKDIVEFLHKFRQNLAKAYEATLYYAINKKIGNWQAKLIETKNALIAFLNNNSVIGIPLYKFAEALGIFLIFLVFRRIFAFFIVHSLRKFTQMTKSNFDDRLVDILEGPLKFSFIILGLYFALLIAGIHNDIFDKILKSLVIFDIFWLFYNAVNILDETIYNFAKKFGRELYREIGSFFIKTLKIFIFAIGLVSILQEWDINVSAFVASLGLGGLAFALAAKDTAANLFGGLSILADRALKLDDWIKVGDVEGTVEEIGLRTTKVRTFEKSLVTVPNQIIANNPIENFSRRNVRRIKMRIGLIYGTTQEQMQNILTEMRNMLQSHPGIAKKATLLVNFDEFEDSSLSIFIYCFTNTAEWAKYLEIREDVNLKIIEIVHRNGSDFAFPSESIYIEKIAEK